MPRFGASSRTKLNTCDPRLQRIFEMVVKHMDCSVIDGVRSDARQLRFFEQGDSTINGVTRKSKHQSNPSMAADVVPYPIDWTDIPRFENFMYFVKGVAAGLGIRIRCGGEWTSFRDYPHYELVD